MKKVFKYQIEARDSQTITMPKGAEILTVQVQHGEPCIWALVNPDNEPEEVKLRIHGTGHNVPSSELLSYIGTFQLHGGNFVFHVFRERAI